MTKKKIQKKSNSLMISWHYNIIIYLMNFNNQLVSLSNTQSFLSMRPLKSLVEHSCGVIDKFFLYKNKQWYIIIYYLGILTMCIPTAMYIFRTL